VDGLIELRRAVGFILDAVQFLSFLVEDIYPGQAVIVHAYPLLSDSN
jgi:hypothetical protein